MPIKAFSLVLCLSLFLDACHKGDGTTTDHPFEDITLETRLNFQHTSGVEGRYLLPEIMGSGGALFDYDDDGDLDLFISHLNDRPALLRNDGGNRHNWLGVKLIGTRSNRDGIGARVRLVAGGRARVPARLAVLHPVTVEAALGALT